MADIALGTYTGTGASRSITGVGFQPDVVIIFADGSGAGTSGQFKIAGMSASKSGNLSSSTLNTDAITSLDADGFSLGTNAAVNTSGGAYSYIAFADASGIIATGTYSGNGSSSRNITGIGFEPDHVVVKGFGTGTNRLAPSRYNYAGFNQPKGFLGSGGAVGITGFIADGFTVNSSNNVNASGETYAYFCLKEDDSQIDFFGYTGNGADDRTLALGDFLADAGWVETRGTGVVGVIRSDAVHTGDESWATGTAAAIADQVQDLLSNGIEVGTTRVNNNLFSYGSLWLRESPAVPPEPDKHDRRAKLITPGRRLWGLSNGFWKIQNHLHVTRPGDGASPYYTVAFKEVPLQ